MLQEQFVLLLSFSTCRLLDEGPGSSSALREAEARGRVTMRVHPSSSGGGTWPSSPRLGGEREKLPHLHRLWVRAALRESGLSVQPHHWTVRETVGSLFEVQSRVKLHNDMSRYGFFGPYWYAPIWADMHRYEPKCTNMSRYACTDMSWYAPIWADMKLSTISAAYQLSVIVPSQISVIVSVTKIHIGRPLYWALQT